MAHILLAEDNQSVRHFLGSALRSAGHDVDITDNGVMALAELQADEKPYDLLLTDIVMPGMDGVELASRAADLRPDMKVVFIAGFSAMSLGKPEETPLAARTQRLSKPFHLRDLVQNVDKLLAA